MKLDKEEKIWTITCVVPIAIIISMFVLLPWPVSPKYTGTVSGSYPVAAYPASLNYVYLIQTPNGTFYAQETCAAWTLGQHVTIQLDRFATQPESVNEYSRYTIISPSAIGCHTP
jgi:hypothetical protein